MNKLQKLLYLVSISLFVVSCATDKSKVVATVGTETHHNIEQNDECQINSPKFTPEIALSLVEKWGNDLQWNDKTEKIESVAMNLIANNYQTNATLLPTISANTRSTNMQLYNYFAGSSTESGFLTKHPKMIIHKEEQHVDAMGCGYGIDSGKYDFVIDPNTKKETIVHARYTYGYHYITDPIDSKFEVNGKIILIPRDKGWYIIQHNSAFVPN